MRASASDNLLPHAAKELIALGWRPTCLRRRATPGSRLLQPLRPAHLPGSRRPRRPDTTGRSTSIHVALQTLLSKRSSSTSVRTGSRLDEMRRVREDGDCATARFPDATTGADLLSQTGDGRVGCAGIHSRIRQELHPGRVSRSTPARTCGRVTRWAFLSGASMVRAGCSHRKMSFYPIRNRIDAEGRQLVNGLPRWKRRGTWRATGTAAASWATSPRLRGLAFPWLDVPAFLRAADSILEFRWWTRTRSPRGPWDGSRSSATRPTRWCRGDRTAPDRRSSMPACSPPSCRAGTTRATRSPPTRRIGFRHLQRRPDESQNRRTPSCARSTCAAGQAFRAHRGRDQRGGAAGNLRSVQAGRGVRSQDLEQPGDRA